MFFWLSKILWVLADPGTLLFLALALGTGLLATRWRRAGARLLAATTVAAAAIAILPLGEWGGALLENRFPRPAVTPDKVDGIVVLGGVVDPYQTAARGEESIGGAAERLVAFARLAKRHPEARLVFSGGSGDPLRQDLKEAHAVGPLLDLMGVPGDRVVFEADSRNTHENAILAKELVKPGPDETWILVTSAFHMPRAVGCFRRAGWRILPYPTDFNTAGEGGGLSLRFNVTGGFGRLSAFLHEAIGLLFYRLTGRTDALFPAPEEG
jgi:uncharacterized SAM-binding protein YcdF (DUF218 family)